MTRIRPALPALLAGGGKPIGATITIHDATGAQVARVETDESGAFRWAAPGPGPYLVRLDTGDGHGAEARVGDASPLVPPPTPASAPDVALSGGDPAALAALVEQAVARQIRPLVEAQAEAEARLRLADIVGGVGMILGLAGIALWARGRRR